MTQDQFAALAQLLRLRPGPAQETARLALVEGLKPLDAIARTGIERGAGYHAISRARAGLELAHRATGT